jgi:hypothetical protein
MNKAIRCIQKKIRVCEVDEYIGEALVWAGILNVSRLLAAVADALS